MPKNMTASEADRIFVIQTRPISKRMMTSFLTKFDIIRKDWTSCSSEVPIAENLFTNKGYYQNSYLVCIRSIITILVTFINEVHSFLVAFDTCEIK